MTECGVDNEIELDEDNEIVQEVGEEMDFSGTVQEKEGISCSGTNNGNEDSEIDYEKEEMVSSCATDDDDDDDDDGSFDPKQIKPPNLNDFDGRDDTVDSRVLSGWKVIKNAKNSVTAKKG